MKRVLKARGVLVLGWLLGSVAVSFLAFLISPFLIPLLAGVFVFLYVYFVLAPNNCFFTFVKEGTAKVVVRGDKFLKCLIQWEGRKFDENWNVIEGRERHLFGGLRFYGIWPLDDIYVHKFRWAGVKEDGSVQAKEEWQDFVLLKDDVYLLTLEDVEDANKLPLSLQVFVTARVANPYKALFNVQRWLETVLNRLQPAIRQAISRFTYEALVAEKTKFDEQLWQQVSELGLIGPEGEFLTRYGIEVRKIELRQVEPPQEWRETTLKTYRAKQEAEATLVKLEAKVKEIEETLKAYQKAAGDMGLLVKISEEAKGKDVPTLVLLEKLLPQKEKQE